MDTLPFYIYATFSLTVLLALFIFYRAAKPANTFLIITMSWIAAQSTLALMGFYKIIDAVPPRLPLMALPPLIFIAVLFNTKAGKLFIDSLNIKTLTIFHIIRVPVEVVLYWLYLHKAVPGLMTFEGRNFDMLSGLSAPVVYYLGFVQNKPGNTTLVVWNLICLGLLFNIVINAVLSVPGPLQHFGFGQPNVAILYFPFVLLPAVLVPLVLFAHLATLRRCLINRQNLRAIG